MDASAQIEGNFPIHAYLSYRCKNDRDIQARKRLKALCSDTNITLRYDENCTENGDSLIKFMDDLTSARCVFLFLSPEYFQSAYTLFELIRINEWEDLKKRLIFPLRLTESMVTYQWTTAKNYFDDNTAIRNDLARLLKVDNANKDAIWQRIDSAWNAIIFPHLDRLNVSLENLNADDALSELLDKTKLTVTKAINESTKLLHKTLIEKITAIFSLKNINADDKFREELGLSYNNDIGKIATKLVTGIDAGEGIAILTRIVESKKMLLNNTSTDWIACFNDAEQICGWLLLNSVDPIWWFHNEIKLKRTAKTSLTDRIALHDRNYIEIVISRSLLQSARYILDENKQPKPKPTSQNHDVMYFDVQDNAIKEALLVDIYKDLFGLAPSMTIDLLNKIVTRAKTHHKTQKGKLIYYLVTDDYLETLQQAPWYSDFQMQLAGYLQFICCGQPSNSDERPASLEDQAQLLDQVANLLSMSH
ncbi:MAG: toll/interleukin-1 receptor domain-containing protein [Methylococcales bacterium]|nr:toll/interleukin-1 receptor domain-containing protein [Methylococcales bacterium]